MAEDPRDPLEEEMEPDDEVEDLFLGEDEDEGEWDEDDEGEEWDEDLDDDPDDEGF